MHEDKACVPKMTASGAAVDRNMVLERLLDLVTPLEGVPAKLEESLGLRLAENVLAPMDLPPFNQAAMDGFALRSADTVSASPVSPVFLPVLRDIAAGDVPGDALASRTSIRLLTGGPLPEKADAVIEFEAVNVESSTGHLVITDGIVRGRNVRWRAEEVSVGDTIADKGDRLTPARIGFLASSGIAEVVVRRRPRVVLIVTGAEIVASGDARRAEQIFDALTPMIGGYIRAAGADPVATVRARDDPVAMQTLFTRIVHDEQPDLIVSTAGIARGDRDVVRLALAQHEDVQFVQLLMKPGRFLAYGRVAQVPFIGLPGNPIAAAVSFLQFVVPVIRRLTGLNGVSAKTFPVVVARSVGSLTRDPDCDRILCGVLDSNNEGQLEVTCVGNQSRQGLRSLTGANCLILVRRGSETIGPGAPVEAMVLPFE